ncbi:hypothetical protein [Peribacillus sp. SCS-37]|uniref:hypothetical protein n=1 Tax=Paraperibacillus esterisolvens TaxID=3115296 RepID=UPI0039069FA9
MTAAGINLPHPEAAFAITAFTKKGGYNDTQSTNRMLMAGLILSNVLSAAIVGLTLVHHTKMQRLVKENGKRLERNLFNKPM